MPKRSAPTARRRALAAFVRTERHRAGLRQVDVARVLGRPQSWVARIESASGLRVDVIEFRSLHRAGPRIGSGISGGCDDGPLPSPVARPNAAPSNGPRQGGTQLSLSFLGLSEASYAKFRRQPARCQRKNRRRRDNSGAGGGSAGGIAMLSNRVAGSASR